MINDFRSRLAWWIIVYLIPAFFVLLLLYVNSNFEEDILTDSLKKERVCKVPKKTLDYCQHFKTKCNHEYFGVAIRYYCSKYYPSRWLQFGYTSLIFVTLLLLIIALSLLVSNYLIININNLTKLLGINNQILSFIIIPLTNCLPDLINYNLVLRANTLELVLGQVVGSNLISFTLIIGLIIYIRPLNIVNYKFILFNFVWVLLVLGLFIYIIADGRITRFECLIMCFSFTLYISYLIWYDQRVLEELVEEGDESLSPCLTKSLDIEETIALINDENSSYGANDEEPSEETHKHHKWGHHLQYMFDGMDMLLFIVVPVSMDYPGDHKVHEWKRKIASYKAVRCWYAFASSALLYYYIGQKVSLNFPVFAGIALVAVEIAHALLNLTSYSGMLKKFIVDVAGLVDSLMLVSFISIHLLKLLKNLGVIMQLSDYLLGLFIFSIVNSANDIIMNLSLSLKMNSLLGVNSCLGTPLLSILVGVGVNGFCILFLNNQQSFKFKISRDLLFSVIGLALIISFYLVYIPLNGWKLDKRLGIMCFLGWICITLLNFMH